MSEQREESEAVKAARARVAQLKAQSNKLDPDTKALAELAREEIAEIERLDEEGAEALKARAFLAQSEAIAKLTPEQRATLSVEAVCDWPTHKRTGRGLIVVTSLDRDMAIKALKPNGKVDTTTGRTGAYDTSDEAVLNGLLSAALWPPPGDIQMICAESPMFAALAYRTAVYLSGLLTSSVEGKSDS